MTEKNKWYEEPGEVGLMLLVVLITLFSLGTTVLGLEQIIPPEKVPHVAKLTGIAMQVTIFLLVSGFAMRNTPVRKWVVVLVFWVVCAYTSFYGNFVALGGNAKQAKADDEARAAHADFLAAVVAPLQQELKQHDAEASRLDAAAKAERLEGRFTDRPGLGPKSRELASQAENHRKEKARLVFVVEQMNEMLKVDLSGMTAQQIYNIDLRVWSTLPAELRVGKQMPDRSRFVDPTVANPLLMPVHALKEGDINAIVSAVFAAIVDGALLILGSATRGRRRSMFDSMGAIVGYFIGGVKNLRAIVKDALARPGAIEDRPSPQDERELEGSIVYVELLASNEHPASKLIEEFRQHIDPFTGKFDASTYESLGPLYRVASRELSDRFRAPRVGWMGIHEELSGERQKKDTFAVEPMRYWRMAIWLSDTIAMFRTEEAEKAEERAGQEASRTYRVRVGIPVP